MRIEDRRQDLDDGLLYQPVDHVWYTEQPLTAIGFVDGLPSHRTRPVRAIEKLLSNRVANADRNQLGNLVMVIPSGPGAPRFALTFFHAVSRLPSSTTASIKDFGNKLKAGCSARAAAVASRSGQRTCGLRAAAA